jgi:Tol biopolymer transport system component
VIVKNNTGIGRLACAALLLAGCNGGQNSGIGPASSQPSATDPTLAVVSSAADPTTVAPSTTAPSTPVALASGEPWIVYEGPLSDGHGSVGNRLVRPDGKDDHWATPQVPLPKNGWQVHPDWNPAGTRLAFAADDASGDGTRDIWVSQPDGTAAERLFDCINPCFQADHPAWSPDGRTIVFDAADFDVNHPDQEADARLLLLDVATGSLTTVTTGGATDQFLWPRWSPDGKRVVLEIEHYTSPSLAITVEDESAIAVVDLAHPGAKPKFLTDFAMWATYPDWHPKEDLIVFSTRPWADLDEGPSNLYTIRPNGTAMHQLTHYAQGQTRAVQPSWTPDGTSIIYTAVEGTGFGKPTMAMIDRDGSNVRSATSSGPMFGTHPRLRPGT